MKQEVTIDENEVNQAILDYAEKHGVKLENVATKVTVVAGRGDRGVYATIAIEPNNVSVFDKEFVSKDLGTSKMYVHTETIKTLQDTPQVIDEGVPVEATQEVDDDEKIFE